MALPRSACRKTMSLRASAHTGVAIPWIFKHFVSNLMIFPLYLGNRHTILRDG